MTCIMAKTERFLRTPRGYEGVKLKTARGSAGTAFRALIQMLLESEEKRRPM